ncbi:MAG: hypothetical protein HC915_04765 [Anaerolineae bacterium]|nr:hypothetical protein [Anaerolineae bacterium]
MHLSLGKPRDMSRFGSRWQDHLLRLEQSWRTRVQPQDVVLLLGDISWASSYRRARPDLEWVGHLPGRKVLVRGNHDRWWRNIEEVRRSMLPPGCYALQGDCMELDGVLLCGAQGHIAPHDPYYRPDPPTNRYKRELATLAKALLQAKHQRRLGQPLAILMHYPPFTSNGQPTRFSELIEQHAPAHCLYGHLHQEYEWQVAVNQPRAGISYRLLAADFVGMIPQRLEFAEGAAMPVINRTPYQNLILTGTIGVGKTGAGRLAAELTPAAQFIDLETTLEQRAGYSAARVRELFGESRLRSLETELIREVSLHRSSILAVSGSTLVDENNRTRLAETGPILCLTAALGEILRRLHVKEGGHFHDPRHRQAFLGQIKRERRVLGLGLPVLDTTGLPLEQVAEQVTQFWRAQADT